MNPYRVSRVVLSAVAALSLAGSALAAPVVTNPGFEADVSTNADQVITGWLTLGGSSGLFVPAPADLPQAVGTNEAYVYNYSGIPANTLFQQVDTAFAANTTYTLKVLVGDMKKGAAPTQWPFPDTVRLGIYNGTTNSGNLLTDTLNTTDITTSPGDGLAAYYTVSYTTGAVAPTGPVVIGLSVLSANAAPINLATFDDVTITVPEPASIGTLIGATGLMVLRRRRSK